MAKVFGFGHPADGFIGYPNVHALGTSPLSLRDEAFGQAPILILVSIVLVIIGVIMIFVGITTATSGCIGSGLMWIGGGIIIGDFGGFVQVQTPPILIAGGAGAVILLVGAGARAFGAC